MPAENKALAGQGLALPWVTSFSDIHDPATIETQSVTQQGWQIVH